MSTFAFVLLCWFASSLLLALPAGALTKRVAGTAPARAIEPPVRLLRCGHRRSPVRVVAARS